MRLTSSSAWTKSSPYPLFNLAKGVNDDSPVLMTTVPIPFTRNLWPPRVVQDESVAWESFKNSPIKYAPVYHDNVPLPRQRCNFKPDKTDLEPRK